jgi:hypothetical protein
MSICGPAAVDPIVMRRNDRINCGRTTYARLYQYCMCVNVILKRKDLGLSIACYRYPDRDEEMYEHLPYHHLIVA